MSKKEITIVTKIMFSLFLFIVIHSFYIGITTKPMEGDSLYYHIPIAESIISSEFLSPNYGEIFHKYFPGATELILAIFILLKIPLNLFNVLGLIVLFIASYFLSRQFDNKKEYSILFASVISTLPVITRWVHAQTVDIWLGAFFISALALLQKPKKKYLYFIKLGVVMGMLIGSKYSGPLFALGLLIVYGKHLFKYLNLKNFLSFNIGIGVLGISWYIRNWIVKSNPFYPLDTFLFQGLEGNGFSSIPIWKTIINYPTSLLNAFFGEYVIWTIAIPTMFLFLFYKTVKRKKVISNKNLKLVTLSLFNLLIFLILPSGSSYQLHVSQFRFSYPVFIPLILSVFLLAQKHKQTKSVALLSFSNLIVLTSLSYNPKLLIIWLPIVFLVFNKKQNIKNIK